MMGEDIIWTESEGEGWNKSELVQMVTVSKECDTE